MQCAVKSCLASYTWFSYPDDPVLAFLARDAGWRLHDVAGWICPYHSAQVRTAPDLIAGDADLIVQDTLADSDGDDGA